MTPQEARLWLRLRELRSRGYHFRRQAPLRGYFLDFVCFNYRLVIEVDGSGHFDEDRTAHDHVRDKVLEREGFRTLRVTNADVNANLEGVFQAVLEALRGAKALRP